MSHRRDDTRAALALSNIGVALQERDCPALAEETFRDAVNIMEQRYNIANSLRPYSLLMQDRPNPSTQALVDRAVLRLAAQSRSKRLGDHLTRLADDTTASAVAQAIRARERVYYYFSGNERTPELDHCRILYNYYQARWTSGTRKRRSVAAILQRAAGLLSDYSAQLPHREEPDEWLQERICSLAAVLTSSLMDCRDLPKDRHNLAVLLEILESSHEGQEATESAAAA